MNISTQYEEHLVPHIVRTVKAQGYTVTTQYLKQFPFQDLGYSNTEKVRAETLLSALLDPKVDIIWFVRGGGGGINLIPHLYNHVAQIKKTKPKTIIGYSDITALHMFINDKIGWQSVHGTLAAGNVQVYNSARMKGRSLSNDREPIANVAGMAKSGVKYDTVIPLNEQAKKGITAPTFGGNFTLVSATFSTHIEPDWNGKLLLLEDVGISFRQLDRSLHQLLFKKQLGIQGIIFGQTFPKYARTEDILAHKTTIKNFAEKWGKPVYYYPVIGHGRKNHPLILNTKTTIKCPQKADYCTLTQPPLK